jgi:hypothetical protein
MVFNTPSACGGVTDQKRVQGLPWGLIPFIGYHPQIFVRSQFYIGIKRVLMSNMSIEGAGMSKIKK